MTFNYTAFDVFKIISTGPLSTVALDVKRYLKSNHEARILIFSDSSGKQMDLDLSGSEKNVLERLKIYKSPELSSAPVGPGRPKLGVISREVSLLPRHWEWLSTQSGGASATLRRLIEDAKKSSSGREQIKNAQERVHQMMSAIAGNLTNYEEALRALYAKDKKRFLAFISDWPTDLRNYAKILSGEVW